MIAILALFTALLIAAVSDLRKQEIPNTALVLLLLSGLISISFYSGGWISRILGFFLIGAAMLIIGLVFKNLGGGDIKTGACIGFALGIIPACYALLAGFLLAACYILIRKRKTKQNTAIPLAPFIGIGCTAVFLFSNLNIPVIL